MAQSLPFVGFYHRLKYLHNLRSHSVQRRNILKGVSLQSRLNCRKNENYCFGGGCSQYIVVPLGKNQNPVDFNNWDFSLSISFLPGVYQNLSGNRSGNHGVKILGYGVRKMILLIGWRPTPGEPTGVVWVDFSRF
jgi:hypothetical protein